MQIRHAFATALLFLVGMAGTAIAGTAVAAAAGEPTWTEMLEPVLQAFRGGDYIAAGAFALVVLTAAFTRYGARFPGKLGAAYRGDLGPLAKDIAGALTVLVGSFGATAGAMLTGPAGVSVALIWTALKIAAGAAGGYTLIKKLLVGPVLRPARAWLATRGRPWSYLAYVLDAVLWVFNRPESDAIPKAVAAGDAAVRAKPPGGAASVVGKSDEVP